MKYYLNKVINKLSTMISVRSYKHQQKKIPHIIYICKGLKTNKIFNGLKLKEMFQ